MIDDPLNRTKVRRGSQLPHAKLDEAKVRKVLRLVRIREAWRRRAARITNARIARDLGVHVNTIDRITAGESWGHVEDPRP